MGGRGNLHHQAELCLTLVTEASLFGRTDCVRQREQPFMVVFWGSISTNVSLFFNEVNSILTSSCCVIQDNNQNKKVGQQHGRTASEPG